MDSTRFSTQSPAILAATPTTLAASLPPTTTSSPPTTDTASLPSTTDTASLPPTTDTAHSSASAATTKSKSLGSFLKCCCGEWEDFKATEKECEANLCAIDEAERALDEEGIDPQEAERALNEANRASTLSEDSYRYYCEKMKGWLHRDGLCQNCAEFVLAMDSTLDDVQRTPRKRKAPFAPNSVKRAKAI